MVNEGFCPPCQRILSDDSVPEERENARLHHADGASFQQALDVGCHICIQSWVQFKRPTALGQTRYYLMQSQLPDCSQVSIVHYEILRKVRSSDIALQSNYLGSKDLQSEDTQSKNSHLSYRWLGGVNLHLRPWPIEHNHMTAAHGATKEVNTGLSGSTRSRQSFAFLTSKYQRCRANHQKCFLAQTGQYLPTRLLDIGTEEAGSICLVSRKNFRPNAEYSTLSHCWGQAVSQKLTSSTEAMLRSGIAIGELPRTFQHAVEFSKELKIPYLWIDSLCIFQDDLEDWSAEAASMRDVYQGAALNIAATAAKDSNVGLFFDRSAREIEPFKVDIAWLTLNSTSSVDTGSFRSFLCFTSRRTDEVIDSAPLNRRAWVMQERHLSRRIAHYTKEEIFWECQEMFVSETHPDRLPIERVDDPDWGTRGLKLLLSSYNEANRHPASTQVTCEQESLYTAWHTFVYWYSQCALTFWEDRVVAFAGVAQQLSKVLGDELVAGLWRSRIVNELCWSVQGGLRPRQHEYWMAPTWSWISLDVGVTWYWSRGRDLDDTAELIKVETEKRPSGALKSGYLDLRCRPLAAVLQHETQELVFKSDGACRHFLNSPSGWQPDDTCFQQGVHDIFVVVLQEGKGITWSYDPTNKICGLILVPTEREDTAFERAGMFSFDYDIENPYDFLGGEIAVRYKDAEEQIITII